MKFASKSCKICLEFSEIFAEKSVEKIDGYVGYTLDRKIYLQAKGYCTVPSCRLLFMT